MAVRKEDASWITNPINSSPGSSDKVEQSKKRREKERKERKENQEEQMRGTVTTKSPSSNRGFLRMPQPLYTEYL